jgi:hypothetical protein
MRVPSRTSAVLEKRSCACGGIIRRAFQSVLE